MKDVKIHFNGASGATIDLTSMVEDKFCCEQECLVNLATEQGTDPMYADRGTTIMQSALSGAVVGLNDAIHVGNFAALDTVRFVVVNYPGMQMVDGTTTSSLLQDVNITKVKMETGVLSYGVQIVFTDDTETGTIDVALAVQQ